MAVHFAQSFKAKQRCVDHQGLYPDVQYLIIRIPRSRVLKIFARSLFLAFVLASFPYFGSIFEKFVSNSYQTLYRSEYDSIDFEFLPLMFHDLTNEGLLKLGDKALFINNGDEESAIYASQKVINNIMDIVSISDLERQSSIPDGSIDFAFANGYHATAAAFIDRSLKIGGIAAIQLSNNPSVSFQNPSNYKIVYLRRFGSTIMAMKKTSDSETKSPPQRRRLCGVASEAKKAALKNLEDVLLEPPRASSGRSSRYLKRTRFLPDLMGDTLESYPRRVFIDVGIPEKNGGSGTEWFGKNYPTRNLKFEMYKIETVTAAEEEEQIGMSEWLKRNVKDEEYVVMKAEAEAVEEMVKSKAIMLVDELFLECKPQGRGRKMNGSRKAYWQCLALYGKLRDEGVAVHQWWGS